MDKNLRWILVLASMALVFWIRMLPLSLPITDPWAEDSVWRAVQERVAREVDPGYSPERWRDEVSTRARRWIEQNKEEFERRVAAKSRDLKARMQFDGDDGREYAYLGDFDSYLWLRNARTYLQKGTPCDAVINGECRNTYNYAPLGSRVVYDRQLHTSAIVVLHRLATCFDPGFPLSASAFLLPVIVGVLGVIPAFFIGCRLAGNLGGLFAALIISLQPSFLVRSIGGDNDVWNVVLPLFMMWAAMAGMTTPSNLRRISYGALAAIAAGMHAATWRGWFFTYGILLFCLVTNVLLESVRVGLEKRTYQVWRAKEVQGAALLTAVFYVTAGCLSSLVGAHENYFAIPVGVLMGVADIWAQSKDSLRWPDVLGTVAELMHPGLDGVINSLGGSLFLFGGLVGLVLLLLPLGRWGWRHLATLLFAASIDVYVLAVTDMGGSATVLLLSAPLATALVLAVCNRAAHRNPEVNTAILVIVWFMGALYVAYGGVRYIELMGAPFGIALAVTAGRLYERLRSSVDQAAPWKRATAHMAYLSAAVLLLSHPVQLGYGAAGGYAPVMNDAWWDTLEEIRHKSRPDAIVNTWWDHGYWVAYVSQRRVSHDGSALLSHVPHWVGKALVTPSETQSVGLFRMLNCGSDATPLPEGQKGAYGKLLRTSNDPIVAYALVEKLANLDTVEAKAYLDKQGIKGSEQQSILESTHCTPPEAFLITNTQLLTTTSSWMHLGVWDPRRSHIASTLRFWPRARAVADLVTRFGYSEEQARALYSRANNLASQGRLDDFIAPQQGYLSQWHACAVAAETGTTVCPLEKGTSESVRPGKFVYDPAAPEDAGIRAGTFDGSGGTTPAVILVAGVEKVQEIELPSPTHAHLGVLLDVPGERIVFGTPELLRSTFAHLMLLDGRYATHYEKFAERTSHTGDRIVVWKINWRGRIAPKPNMNREESSTSRERMR